MAKIIPKCPTCGKVGQVARKMKHGALRMECLHCGEKWESLSGKCPDCGLNNGFAGSGRCATCYEIRREDKAAG